MLLLLESLTGAMTTWKVVARQSVGLRAHGSGALPTGGLPTAAPRTRSSVPVNSGVNAMLLQAAVSVVEAPVGEGLRYPERTWQQDLSLEPELPQFTKKAAFVEGTQSGTEPDQCTRPALQAGNWVEGEGRGLDDRTTDPGLPDRCGTLSAGHSSAFHHVGGGDLPPSVPVTTCVGIDVVEHDVPSTSTSLKCNIAGVGIKLGTCDGSTCLEAFWQMSRTFPLI